MTLPEAQRIIEDASQLIRSVKQSHSTAIGASQHYLENLRIASAQVNNMPLHFAPDIGSLGGVPVIKITIDNQPKFNQNKINRVTNRRMK